MKSALNHVALLVPSVDQAATALAPFGHKIHDAAEWEGEGTREIYVGDFEIHMATLLLMEPIKEGAYTRAMKKRGPGLHHLGIDVLDLEGFIDEIAGSGWLLHPKSLHTIKHSKTAYLARPGVPTLIEVQQREKISVQKPVVENIHIPGLRSNELTMFKALGLEQVTADQGGELGLTINGRQISFSTLLA